MTHANEAPSPILNDFASASKNQPIDFADFNQPVEANSKPSEPVREAASSFFNFGGSSAPPVENQVPPAFAKPIYNRDVFQNSNPHFIDPSALESSVLPDEELVSELQLLQFKHDQLHKLNCLLSEVMVMLLEVYSNERHSFDQRMKDLFDHLKAVH